eukprot:TRINITY_DN2375_c0_g1_i1.p1 TRINITY_DN2375_c0_g1~~TRINITY_DN2375_c0_g1_i1.p1  ORF type:complete len:4335 (+),score=913.34 TRINITY_DN2375_c0_g1_i1:198-13202(+)
MEPSEQKGRKDSAKPADMSRIERAKMRVILHDRMVREEEATEKPHSIQRRSPSPVPKPGEWKIAAPFPADKKKASKKPTSTAIRPYPRQTSPHTHVDAASHLTDPLNDSQNNPNDQSLERCDQSGVVEDSLLDAHLSIDANNRPVFGAGKSSMKSPPPNHDYIDTLLKADHITRHGKVILSNIKHDMVFSAPSPLPSIKKESRTPAWYPLSPKKARLAMSAANESTKETNTRNIRAIMDALERGHAGITPQPRSQSSLAHHPDSQGGIAHMPLRPHSVSGLYGSSPNASLQDSLQSSPHPDSSAATRMLSSGRHDALPPLSSPPRRVVQTDPQGFPTYGDEIRGQPVGFFPLDDFDDQSFEIHAPEEWIAAGGPDGISAFSKYFATDGSWTWEPCRVIGYDRAERRFVIEWQHSKKKKHVSRLNLIFNNEDRSKFSQRLESALFNRQIAESQLRYANRLDQMPLKNLPTIPVEQLDRIIYRLGFDLTGKEQQIYTLAVEVRNLYKRTVNKFDLDMRVNSDDPSNLLVPAVQAAHTRPRTFCPLLDEQKDPEDGFPFYERVDIMDRSLIIGNQRLHRSLLFIAEHIFGIFSVVFVKPVFSMTQAEYESLQLRNIWAAFADLKQSMLANMSGTIISSLNEETDRIGELPRYRKAIRVCNQILQSAIRIAVLQALHKIAETFERYLDDPELRSKPVLMAEATQPGIFVVKITAEESSLVFDPELPVFADTVIKVAHEIIKCAQNIPYIDCPTIDMESNSPTLLNTCTLDEPLVKAPLDRIRHAIEQLTIPPREYIKQYAGYHKLLRTNLEDYMSELTRSEKSLPDIRKEIDRLTGTMEEIRDTLSNNISINVFLFDLEQFRDTLLEKCDSLRNILLEHVYKTASNQLLELKGRMDDTRARLQQPPSDPEELATLREFIRATVESEKEVAESISSVMQKFDFLEEFNYSSEQMDFGVKWEVFGMPRAIQQALQEVDRIVQIERLRMIRELRSNQKSLDDKLAELTKSVEEVQAYDDIDMSEAVGDQVRQVQGEFAAVEAMYNQFCRYESLFGFEKSDNPVLRNSLKTFEPIFTLWTMSSEWLLKFAEWTNSAFNTLNADQMDKYLNNNGRIVRKLIRQFKTRKENCALRVANQLKNLMDDFKQHMPLISKLRHPGVKVRHWEALATKLGFNIPAEGNFSLEYLINLHLEQYPDIVNSITDVAINEYTLESALDKMAVEMRGISVDLMAYKETGTHILRTTDDLLGVVDDQVVTVQTMLSSPFIKPLEQNARDWLAKLRFIQELFDQWTYCQRQWLYLQPIFASEDINRQLPVEGRKYSAVDLSWRKVMHSVRVNPKILQILNQERLLEQFKECNQLLEVIMKGLHDYLETKRMAFPRFYFLSNEELLDILAQTRDPRAVQPHLRKCFENVHHLTFTPDLVITALNSAEGEVVNLAEEITAKDRDVEHWLREVERVMKLTIKNIITEAVTTYNRHPREKWIAQWPGQVVLTAGQIIFTSHMHQGMLVQAKRGLRALKTRIVEQLNHVTTIVRGEIGPLFRMTLGSLLVMDVHNRDTVDSLIESRAVVGESGFEWTKNLRHYLEEGEVTAKMMNAVYAYGYEYLGNTARLVITPLTERCYRTLFTALNLNLGGAPTGPAGTGKTETVKDLAKAVAKQCVVFNCSEGLDFHAMGKFFKGLACAGAWSCFDEFNRIDIEVLSVVAQQILTIQQAMNVKLPSFNFEGSEIVLNPQCAIFITMNPGYAGRTELPDNLKALFRPVAMMVPDYAYICEIILFSEGFIDATPLSKKVVNCFKLASEQLSKQDHYDFGMRAVKAVLSMAGSLKRKEPDCAEDLLLLRALRDCNLPKFLSPDIPLFQGILGDLFPQVHIEDTSYPLLLPALEKCAEELNIIAEEAILTKCIQLFETLAVRHGVMLVGKSFSSKTTCYRLLGAGLSSLHETPPFAKVHTHILNPKSITMGQLYGEFNALSNEWTDGILSHIVRTVSNDNSSEFHWIVLDGPVDSLWVESMNTLLDDNKVLCLTNGERIPLPKTASMLFEVADLSAASPATVSRCGMVYLDSSSTGWKPLVQSWFNRLPSDLEPIRSLFEDLFNSYVESSLFFLRQNCHEPIATTNSHIVRNLLVLLDCFLYRFGPNSSNTGNKDNQEDGFTRVEKDEEDLDAEEEEAEQAAEAQKKQSASNPDNWIIEAQETLPGMFIFCVVWSLGATINEDGRAKFNLFMKERMQLLKHEIPFPEDDNVYGFYFDFESKGWRGWLQRAANYNLQPGAYLSGDCLIPTMDSIRKTFLIQSLIRNGQPVLVCGETGTGKTATISALLEGMDPSKYMPMNVNFSATTSGTETQDMLEARLERRKKGLLGPPAGKKMALFVDDLNMPMPEKYGAQPPLELLRQYLDHGGWYDRKTTSFCDIIDIQVLGAMGMVGGGRHEISARLLRHFNLMYYGQPDDMTFTRVFSIILESQMVDFSAEIKTQTDRCISATLDLYRAISKTLLPTPSKSHYIYNSRDLFRIFRGILMADPKRLTKMPQFVRLWYHECTRVFSDRLVNEQDREWYREAMNELTYRYYGKLWKEFHDGDKLLFCDFANSERTYQQVVSTSSLASMIEGQLDDYNGQTNRPMNLVLFADAVEHVVRICRILRQHQGHALLVGVGGSGRKSVARLAAFIAEQEIYTISTSKSYTKSEWREDLKNILRATGMEGKPTTFILDDSQIMVESFLENINTLLQTGEVPNLFEKEDLEVIIAHLRSIGYSPPIGADVRFSFYSHFLSRVRSNLHVILTMSPVGAPFRNRLRMFPSLVNCCTIDWFNPWPREALQSVAASYFSQITWESDRTKNAIIELAVRIHACVEKSSLMFKHELRRTNHVTPSTFLNLLAKFSSLLDFKKKDVEDMTNRLLAGLEKLQFTSEQVAEMQLELENLVPVLERTTVEMEALMIKIENEQQEADITRHAVMEEEKTAEAEAIAAKEIADSAQAELAQALPALEAALSALNSLSKKDIVEVKSMNNPPAGMTIVIEAVCILMGRKPKKVDGPKPGTKVDDYWSEARIMMNDPHFIQKLMAYDRDNTPEETITKLKPYIDNPAFVPSAVEKISAACKSLCAWVRAMERYYWVAKHVAPKKQHLLEANNALKQTLENLEHSRQRLRGVEEKIANLKSEFVEAETRKRNLVAKVADCQVKVERANRLIGGLGGESVRWQARVARLQIDSSNVIGDVLLSAAYVCYMGAFTASYRTALITDWRDYLGQLGIKATQDYSFVGYIGDPVIIGQWNLTGLPKDNHSIENALISSESTKCPLFIDPQNQATIWIKKRYKGALEVLKMGQHDMVRRLENSIQFGGNVLIEDVGEDLDPVLDPILSKRPTKGGARATVIFADKTLQLNEQFNLMLSTKIPNPNYSPEVFSKVSIINFSVTNDGLGDQLLSIVVAKERPDLENARNELLASNASMKKELKDVEDKILSLLSNSTGNILDDEVLIQTLGQSKATSDDIATRMIQAEATEKEIEITRRSYTIVAKRAALLYFVIADLAHLDHMYQFSLAWFINLFTGTIDDPTAVPDGPQGRLTALIERITTAVYVNISGSLFARHRLLFSFLLTVKIMESSGKLDSNDLRLLLTISNQMVRNPSQNPAPDWISHQAWMQVCVISATTKYSGLDRDVIVDKNSWRIWSDSNMPHTQPLPQGWDTKLTRFQKLVLVRIFRPEKSLNALQDFVMVEMGKRFLEPPMFDLSRSFLESAPNIPLIFVLSPGVDPVDDLFQFAAKSGMANRVQSISLGQGQGPRAETMIADAIDRGYWVLLQNCHLAASWMPQLQRLVEEIPVDRVHHRFRMWLTSMPSTVFPIYILQNGIKLINEPPTGIRANLQRLFLSSVDKEEFSDLSQSDVFHRLSFSLCLFHSVLLERRRFGALGWNEPYEFNDSDLQVSLKQLHMSMTERVDPDAEGDAEGTKRLSGQPAYEALRYVIGEINYGGRVTDQWDRRCLNALLSEYMTRQVLEDDYRFSPSGMYKTLKNVAREQYADYIKNLPLNDPPEVFGMHDNAEITVARSETQRIYDLALSLQPRSAAGLLRSQDEVVSSKVADILTKLPHPYNMALVASKHPISYQNTMSTVIQQEASRYNQLLTLLTTCLQEVEKALKGLTAMSSQLEAVCNSIYDGSVPELWSSNAYPSLKPLGPWIADLLSRIEFLRLWIYNGNPPVFWFPGFFFPQAFLTGVLQSYARSQSIPIDTIAFSNKILSDVEEITEGPESGCYVSGLYLEGATWNVFDCILDEAIPKELHFEMPTIWLKPTSVDLLQTDGFYSCPVYRTLFRAGVLSTTGQSSNHIFNIELPSKQPDKHWVKRGVALFCSLNS